MNRLLIGPGLAACLAALIGAAGSHAAADEPLPGNPVALFESAEPANLTVSGAAKEIVPAKGVPFDRALELDTVRRGGKPWDVQFTTPMNKARISKGDTLYYEFYTRCLRSADESGEGQFSFYIQRPSPTWLGLHQAPLNVGPQWKRVRGHCVAGQDFAPGTVNVVLQQGTLVQTLQFGGLKVFNLGQRVDPDLIPKMTLTYAGMQPDASWRKAAAQRIDQHRKADLFVSVVDGAGAPVKGAKVSIRMLRHSFGFGTFVGGKDAGRTYAGDLPTSELFRSKTRELFNKVTLPMYWADGWGWPDNKATYLKVAEMARKDGLALRAHVIVYPGFIPKKVMALQNNPPALRKAINDHIVEILTATRHLGIAEWDVTNEFRHNHDVQDILGKNVMVEWFKVARKTDPHTKLYINENQILTSGGKMKGSQDHYYQTIKYLLDNGAPVDGIGMQGHMKSDLTPPEKIIEILDRFAQFDLPIQITEFDLPLTDKQAQAQYTADFLTTVFSHPSVDTFIMWGFLEGHMAFENAELASRDGNLRPNGQAYHDLVYGTWWTDEQATTDATGQLMVRGFLGDYEITATAQGRTQTVQTSLDKDGRKATITLQD